MSHHLDNHRPGEDDPAWLLIFGRADDAPPAGLPIDPEDVWSADAPPHPLARRDGSPSARDALRNGLGDVRGWGRRAG